MCQRKPYIARNAAQAKEDKKSTDVPKKSNKYEFYNSKANKSKKKKSVTRADLEKIGLKSSSGDWYFPRGGDPVHIHFNFETSELGAFDYKAITHITITTDQPDGRKLHDHIFNKDHGNKVIAISGPTATKLTNIKSGDQDGRDVVNRVLKLFGYPN